MLGSTTKTMTQPLPTLFHVTRAQRWQSEADVVAAFSADEVRLVFDDLGLEVRFVGGRREIRRRSFTDEEYDQLGAPSPAVSAAPRGRDEERADVKRGVADVDTPVPMDVGRATFTRTGGRAAPAFAPTARAQHSSIGGNVGVAANMDEQTNHRTSSVNSTKAARSRSLVSWKSQGGRAASSRTDEIDYKVSSPKNAHADARKRPGSVGSCSSSSSTLNMLNRGTSKSNSRGNIPIPNQNPHNSREDEEEDGAAHLGPLRTIPTVEIRNLLLNCKNSAGTTSASFRHGTYHARDHRSAAPPQPVLTFEDHAAQKLTKIVRGKLVRNSVERMRREMHLAAAKIAALWKNSAHIRSIERMRRQIEEEARLAASDIESEFLERASNRSFNNQRGGAASGGTKSACDEQSNKSFLSSDSEDEEQDDLGDIVNERVTKAVEKIVAVLRGHMDRTQTAQMKMEMTDAANTIKAYFRGARERAEVRRVRKAMHEAAFKIQQAYKVQKSGRGGILLGPIFADGVEAANDDEIDLRMAPALPENCSGGLVGERNFCSSTVPAATDLHLHSGGTTFTHSRRTSRSTTQIMNGANNINTLVEYVNLVDHGKELASASGVVVVPTSSTTTSISTTTATTSEDNKTAARIDREINRACDKISRQLSRLHNLQATCSKDPSSSIPATSEDDDQTSKSSAASKMTKQQRKQEALNSAKLEIIHDETTAAALKIAAFIRERSRKSPQQVQRETQLVKEEIGAAVRRIDEDFQRRRTTAG
ncbi:unnamed protein product [Amoebophrya sp. A120]|nr:unnamed protein product [Amoebophrya sp. A120]|eukprot:GSA120T00012658001.1